MTFESGMIGIVGGIGAVGKVAALMGRKFCMGILLQGADSFIAH